MCGCSRPGQEAVFLCLNHVAFLPDARLVHWPRGLVIPLPDLSPLVAQLAYPSSIPGADLFFGIRMHGYCNGNRLSQRLVRRGNGFFIQVHYESTPFLLNELFQSAPLHANTLHTVGDNPSAGGVRWSTVYIAGGYTLIFSRHYETVGAHSKHELIGGLQHRFPDLVSENFDLGKVHPSMHTLDPVVNLARQRYVVAPVEGDPHVIVVLKLDLPPYKDIGAIFALPS